MDVPHRMALHPHGMDHRMPDARGIVPEALRLARSLSRSFALHVAVRVLESLSVGWLACALVVAAAAATAPVTPNVWIAAGACAFLAAASLWIQHPPRRDEHVRAADRRLAFEGALITTAGVVPDARAGSLPAALVRRVVARLRSGDLARAALPRTPIALLACLAGTALLFAAQEAWSSDATRPARENEKTAESLASAAQSLRSAALDARSSPGARPSSTTLDALATRLDLAASSPKSWAAETERLQREIAAVQASSPDTRVARALDQASSALESARRAAASDSSSTRSSAAVPSGTPGAGISPGESSSPGAAPSAGAVGNRAGMPSGSEAGARAGSSTALAPEPADGRMSAPIADPRARAASGVIGSTTSVTERGVGAARWWPPAYDAVVERWLAGDAPVK